MTPPLDELPTRVRPGGGSRTAGMETPMANLSRRVEQTLGIRVGEDALRKLKVHLEAQYGAGCFDSPHFYEQILSFPEDIFSAARFLTINETYFFRETIYFDLLLQELLPRFARLNRPVRICSAATSIGCEAYSLAMVADDFCRTVRPLSFRIDAFDVNPEVMETAKRGWYTANTLREDGARWKFLLDRYTQPEGTGFVVDSGLRKHVHFYTHNLLDGFLGNHYDLIFFRNALIYFSPDKRTLLLDKLSEALFDGAVLVLGVSETPLVSHPLLESKYALDAFYFQRIPDGGTPEALRPEFRPVPAEAATPPAKPPRKTALPESVHPELIASLLNNQGGSRPIVEKIPLLLQGAAEGVEPEGSVNELFAAVIFLLGQEDFPQVDTLLSFIEKHDRRAFTCFLRGEYHYFKNRQKKAEACYTEAAAKDESFWPAFYRLCALAAGENPVRYKYKARKALESIDRGREKRYEIFIGGFSPDYYRRALEKRLS